MYGCMIQGMNQQPSQKERGNAVDVEREVKRLDYFIPFYFYFYFYFQLFSALHFRVRKQLKVV